MRESLEKYSYVFNNVEKIDLIQKDNIIPVESIIKGNWKIFVICSKKTVSGIYFFNTDYVSQIYKDIPLQIKKGGLNVVLNDCDIGDKITEINKLKIFKNGFSIDKKANLFISTYMNELCGFLIIISR